jgi:hypothetical protein
VEAAEGVNETTAACCQHLREPSTAGRVFVKLLWPRNVCEGVRDVYVPSYEHMTTFTAERLNFLLNRTLEPLLEIFSLLCGSNLLWRIVLGPTACWKVTVQQNELLVISNHAAPFLSVYFLEPTFRGQAGGSCCRGCMLSNEGGNTTVAATFLAAFTVRIEGMIIAWAGKILREL